MNKVIFLDVDGTLVNDNGVVPKSAADAIKETRKNGNYVFLCTGRSKAEIYDHIWEIGFDGVIAAAGGYIESENQVVFHETIQMDSARHVIDYFAANNIEFYLESNGGLFASQNLKAKLNSIIYKNAMDEKTKAEIEEGIQPFFTALIENQEMLREDINKISFIESDVPFDTIKREFEQEFNVIHCTVPSFGENSGELSIPNINKANAIEKLLKHLNLPDVTTYAYGDGMNDLEMIQYVDVGVAMGNAKQKLKEAADDITETHDEGGIYNSFKKYALV